MTKTRHAQKGIFHVTTVTRGRMPWCMVERVPDIILDNLFMTKNLQKAKIFAFCILPDHMHMILEPGTKGLSMFMKSFKENSSRDVRGLFCDDNSFFGDGNVGGGFRFGGRFGSRDAGVPATETMSSLIPATNQRLPSHIRATDDMNDPQTLATDFEIDEIYWQPGFHDVRIRDEQQFAHVKSYVESNAFRHDLVDDSTQWPWSSLHFRHLLDGQPYP